MRSVLLRAFWAKITFAVSLCIFCKPAFSAPSIFWASDPVGPGETALIVGHELDKVRSIKLELVPDTPLYASGEAERRTAVVSWRQSTQTLYFAPPSDWRWGVYRYELTGPDGSAVGTLNRPVLYWYKESAARGLP